MRHLTIKELEPEYQPYEKFLSYGSKALSDAELLAIILRTGSKGEHSVELARKILTPKGDDPISILNIFNYEYHELLRIPGVGKVKALQIKALAELSLRIAQSHAVKQLVFNRPSTVAEYYMEQLCHNKTESVVLLLLDSACGLIQECAVSSGTVNASLLSAREILLLALKYEAVSMILLHNHPSGKADPSSADLTNTEAIASAGELIGIPLSDHIIIGDHCYYSFQESGLL